MKHPSSVNEAADIVNRTENELSQASHALHDAYKSFDLHRRTGQDTSADLKAIQTYKQAMKQARSDYKAQLAQLRVYQIQDALERGQPPPRFSDENYYLTPDGSRWDGKRWHRPSGWGQKPRPWIRKLRRSEK